MKKTTKSLMEELNAVSAKKDQEAAIESRANHIINGAVNLLEVIKKSFTEEESLELERRFFSSIKSGDTARFMRSIRKVRDSRQSKKADNTEF